MPREYITKVGTSAALLLPQDVLDEMGLAGSGKLRYTRSLLLQYVTKGQKAGQKDHIRAFRVH